MLNEMSNEFINFYLKQSVPEQRSLSCHRIVIRGSCISSALLWA